MAEFKEIMRQYARMCESFGGLCYKCRMYSVMTGSCREFIMLKPERAETVIMDWAAEHPEKTMKDVFFEKFPDAPKRNDELPKLCPDQIGFTNFRGGCGGDNCIKCWNRPVPDYI